MKKIIILVFAASMIFSCSKTDNSKVLATIDNEKITIEEFNKDLDKIPVNMKMIVATQSGKKNYLDKMIIKKLLLREAKKENIEKEKEFQDRLNEIKEQLVLETLLKKKINLDSQITEEDMKKYYEKNKETFKREREINTRHILLNTEEEARQIKDKLAKGEDFAELARRYSIDPSAKASGGEIGFHPKGSLLPEYEDAAFKLKKVGQTSGIVKTKFGYHIIKLEGIKPPSYVPYEEVKDYIKQKLAQEKQTQALEKYITDLKQSAKITINEDLLKDARPEVPEKQEKTEKTDTQPKPEKKTEPAAKNK
ncbi:MAG TPA: peptidylprolyl isomerase [Syntrophorhabdaceae bacterium]|nr:peptidylprolyl isomerase [Syntrophorhabdaceae bacterium]HOL06135.1 peptidylprolyl isomerase [Syntrophorhabdaceae bacterium]HON84873.1 peptidylprolyl isomerase [Syntrophorhabdaceae bacterium]HOT41487.1 peptidylprolyl isomerase [Syntrophorhabdaceae bacterium]HPC65958.1 peptidylprolyl isomerase [Syntrophorhabdaceae bacterium]